MSLTEFSQSDLQQLAARGISIEQAQAQLRSLRQPPAPVVLDRACTVGDGIVTLDSAPRARLLEVAEEAAAAGRVAKFVPASGAATRMFKDLIEAHRAGPAASTFPAARDLFTRLDDFAFGAEVRRHSGVTDEPETPAEELAVLRVLLEELRYAELPKGLVLFHRGETVRTAFEEHLLEGARYVRTVEGICLMHFTVPAEFRADFERLLHEVAPRVHARLGGVTTVVTFSEQHPSTDTLALDADGRPFRLADGSLLFRPSGHGALLKNLEDLGGDLVVIKNIDNVLPDERSGEVVRWKRLLVGYLADLQAQVFAHLRSCAAEQAANDSVDAALRFARATFARPCPFPGADADDRRRAVVDALDRPIRVCGVVRNEGEPGGAPFWVRQHDGCTSVQIVEPSQVSSEPTQTQIFRSATHFNPVDLVCGLRSFRGEPFALERFVDPDTAFVTSKSYEGRTLKALERPGLWNGAMAGWNTVCVEVPASTFAPVKTVFDLLRPEHQPTGSDESGA